MDPSNILFIAIVHICCTFLVCDIHWNELCQIDLITGAHHGVNPSNLFCVSIHGNILFNFVKKYSVNHWSCMIYIGMNYVKLTITGAPHGVNPSLNLLGVPIHGEDLHTSLTTSWTGFTLIKST